MNNVHVPPFFFPSHVFRNLTQCMYVHTYIHTYIHTLSKVPDQIRKEKDVGAYLKAINRIPNADAYFTDEQVTFFFNIYLILL
jgi:hypothetical protein